MEAAKPIRTVRIHLAMAEVTHDAIADAARVARPDTITVIRILAPVDR